MEPDGDFESRTGIMKTRSRGVLKASALWLLLALAAIIVLLVRLNLTFDLPDDLKTQVNCNAVVTWLNRKPNPMKPHYPHGIGLRFVDLPDFAHRAILRMNEKKTPG